MREATLTVYGFTAGGSGMASVKAITVNAARTQIMHDCDFIAGCVPNLNDNGFPVLQLGEVTRKVVLQRRQQLSPSG